ncbi:4Fe-4S binding protein, partial [Chloroflexota bacterium]
TPEQANIVRELPATPEEIAVKLNLAKELVDNHLEELREKGLVVVTRHGPRMVRNTLQLHDAATTNYKFDESLGDEYFDLWAAYQLEEHQPSLVETLAGSGFPYSRIVPRWRSIDGIPGVMPWEDIREILKTQETIALVPCPCKRSFRNRECGLTDETCLNVGRTAMYNLGRGVGRKLTYEEALDFCEQTDELPFVHITINQKSINMLVCNCHWCCCELILPLLRQDKYKTWEGLAKSRFEATVEPEKCHACKICVERCQFEAAQMKYHSEFGVERAYIDSEKCMGCGCCVISCPGEARAMKLVRSPEHVPDVGPVVY